MTTPASNLSDEQRMNKAFDSANEGQCMSYEAYREGWRAGALDRARATAEPVMTIVVYPRSPGGQQSMNIQHDTDWSQLPPGEHKLYALGATVAPSPAPDKKRAFEKWITRGGFVLDSVAREWSTWSACWDYRDVAALRAASGASHDQLEKDNHDLRLHVQRLTKARDDLLDEYEPILPAGASPEPTAELAGFLTGLAGSLRTHDIWWPGTAYADALAKECEKYVAALAVGTEIPQKQSEPTVERKCLTPGAIYSIDTKTWSPCIDFSVTLLSQHQKLLVTEDLSKALEQAFHDAIEPILATIWTKNHDQKDSDA